MVPTLGWIDVVFASIFLLSFLWGCWRGLVFELMSLVGWLVAYMAALVWAPYWAPSLPIGQPGGALNSLAAYGLVFLVVLIVWGLLAKLVRWLIHATPLGVVDRVLGGSFGTLRGAVIVLCVTTAVWMTPWSRSPQWQASVGARYATQALLVIKPWLPPQIARFFPLGLT